MAEKERGSAGLALLLGSLFLLAVGQMLLLFAQRSYEAGLAYFRSYQLRLLAHSALLQAEADEEDDNEERAQEAARVLLQPGARQAVVTLEHEGAGTSLAFHRRRVRAKLENAGTEEVITEQLIQRFTVNFDESWRQLAATYGLVCHDSLTGAEYLPEGTVYASNREVNYPQDIKDIEKFLRDRSVGSDLAAEIQDSGLMRQVYYLQGAGSFYIPEGQKVWGSAVIVTASDTPLYLKKGCEFRDRVILLCGAPLSIGENVRLPQALIICKRSITIGKGSVVNGLVAAEGSITLNGSCQITKDETAVAPFSSVAFIADQNS